MMVGDGFRAEFGLDICSNFGCVLSGGCDYECRATLSYTAGDCGGGAEVKL
jgi:hypothetical protein